MTQPVIPPDLPQRVKVLQTIWFALVFGTAMALVVFYLLRAYGVFQPAVDGFPLAPVFAAIGGVLVVLAFVVPDRAAAQQPVSLGAYQASRIVQGGLLEGAGFLQGIAYLLEGQAWSLALGALPVALLVALTPTQLSATRWLQRRSMR